MNSTQTAPPVFSEPAAQATLVLAKPETPAAQLAQMEQEQQAGPRNHFKIPRSEPSWKTSAQVQAPGESHLFPSRQGVNNSPRGGCASTQHVLLLFFLRVFLASPAISCCLLVFKAAFDKLAAIPVLGEGFVGP